MREPIYVFIAKDGCSLAAVAAHSPDLGVACGIAVVPDERPAAGKIRTVVMGGVRRQHFLGSRVQIIGGDAHHPIAAPNASIGQKRPMRPMPPAWPRQSDRTTFPPIKQMHPRACPIVGRKDDAPIRQEAVVVVASFVRSCRQGMQTLLIRPEKSPAAVDEKPPLGMPVRGLEDIIAAADDADITGCHVENFQ